MEYEFPALKEPFEIEEEHIEGVIKQVKQYEPPMLSLFDDEIFPLSALLTARSTMGMCKHTYW
jgi:hypothetical protein